jgi:hypothetical protein
MTRSQTAVGLRELVSSHINSIADTFFDLGDERPPDFVLGLTTLHEAFAFSSRNSCRRWIAYLSLHKLVSSEGAPQFKIFEHNLSRPSDVFRLTSITPAAAADILLRACGGTSAVELGDGTVASSDFEAACTMATSRTGLSANDTNQRLHLSLAQVIASVVTSAFLFLMRV